jgi:allantoinase
MDVDLVVKGDIVLPSGILRDSYIAVKESKIVGILHNSLGLKASEYVDATGCLILPGLIDTHVHTLSNPDEGIERLTAAAAAGGVTTVIDMPYDAEQPIINATRLKNKIERVAEEAHVDMGLYGTIAKENGVDAIPELIEAGVLAFKFSTFETDPNRFPRISDFDLMKAFSIISRTTLPIVIHAENDEIIKGLISEHIGEDDTGVHLRTRPPLSETSAIVRVLEIGLWTGAHVHIAHVTHPHGFELINMYRRLGAKATGETCVHYLALDSEDVSRLGAIAKVNPPIREPEIRLKLWEAIKDGKVDTITTDHAPWPLDRKQQPMLKASSGIPGLESFLPIMYSEFVERDIPLTRFVELTSSRPAEIFGLKDRKGKLDIGMYADFVIYDPRKSSVYDASKSFSVAKWSPFNGRGIIGQVVATYVRGTKVFEDGKVLSRPGFGIFLRNAYT